MSEAIALESQFNAALEKYCSGEPSKKIAIRFKALGKAPILRQQVYKITASEGFHAIPAFLKRQLNLSEDEQVVRDHRTTHKGQVLMLQYVYLHSFTPAMDETLLNLHNVRGGEESIVRDRD